MARETFGNKSQVEGILFSSFFGTSMLMIIIGKNLPRNLRFGSDEENLRQWDQLA